MRLKHVKLSGFKSFVDATKVAVPNNLVGIVGPNGCGKSNVIDAIRWVMGESSAKTLRGDHMEDVIFNGSSARKPVNRAYVELVFDNADGSAPGTYAKYAEIAIRRELVREGGSKYFINKTRCRRKDIHDIFLGTGLGPRSYSIIEQGMVGRIVESKPEDLRVLIEEAAGISKYKERRRETENRIRHTRDNLSRVEDIVGELATQLRRLKRQANEAERYKTLKAEQTEFTRLGLTLRWSALHQQIQTKDVELERLQTEFESQMAGQRDVESQLESMRQEQSQLTEKLNQEQAAYYGIGGEVASLEQSIQHAQQTRQQQQEEYDRLAESEREATQHLSMDRDRLAKTQTQLVEIEPVVAALTADYDGVSAAFVEAQKTFQNWQSDWETLNREAASPEKEYEVQSASIEQHNRRIQHFSERAEQVAATLRGIDGKLNLDEITALQTQVATIDGECTNLEKELVNADQSLISYRQELEASRQQYNKVRHEMQDDNASLGSLNALQAAALGEDNPQVNEWLQQRGISDNPRIASQLRVQPGWELAVDTVLAKYLNALSVQQLERYGDDMAKMGEGRVSLVDQSSAPVVESRQFDISAKVPNIQSSDLQLLMDKVTAEAVQIDGWFHGVYAADTLAEALAVRDKLAAHESIVTREGCWVGSNWASFGQSMDAETGILQREAKIEQLTERCAAAQRELQKIQFQGEEVQEQIARLEEGREKRRGEFRSKSHLRTQLHNQLGAIEARSSELVQQRDALLQEQRQLDGQLATAKEEVSAANNRKQQAQLQANKYRQQREELSSQREDLLASLETARAAEHEARDQKQARQIELERLQSNTSSLTESVNRLEKQLEKQSERRKQLAGVLSRDEDPTAELRSKLHDLLESRLAAEQRLSKARNDLNDFENTMQSTDQQRLGFDRQSKSVRDNLEAVRLARQEVVVRRDTVAEQLEQDIEQMLLLEQGLPEQLSLSEVEQKLLDVDRKIDRIGAVNLVAIDEFEQCTERKVYLDQQHQDLTEAMATLEAAIAKIDRETRTRFKETFDNLNEGFKQFFPRLFGGGSAYLELTGKDLLDTGVGVMARPPGKRNSTIHLLSGGEKALTAVSLLFAFFDLNPAPFCVLDEVDAPLDDANVERYAGVLKQLGEKTQLLFITHNKITMEVSDILIGVTMAEPGVSRLVTVDVAEAAALAAH